MGVLRSDRVSGLGGANAINGSVNFGGDLGSNGNYLAVGDTQVMKHNYNTVLSDKMKDGMYVIGNGCRMTGKGNCTDGPGSTCMGVHLDPSFENIYTLEHWEKSGIFINHVNDERDKLLKTEEYYIDIDNIYEYKLGFEHQLKLGPAIRMGLTYKQPLFRKLGPITKFTIGSNKKINKRFNIDFALLYFYNDYNYEDIFRVNDLLSNDCTEVCENVKESNLSLSTTLKWNF